MRAVHAAAGRTTNSTSAMYASAKAATSKAPSTCAWATPTTNANRHHAVTSSMAAQPRANTPSGVLSMPRSVRMRASTGNAVIDMATPMNSAKLSSGTPSGDRRGCSHRARAAPSAKGTTMLVCEMTTVWVARDLRRPAFSSRPTRNMYRMTPS